MKEITETDAKGSKLFGALSTLAEATNDLANLYCEYESDNLVPDEVVESVERALSSAYELIESETWAAQLRQEWAADTAMLVAAFQVAEAYEKGSVSDFHGGTLSFEACMQKLLIARQERWDAAAQPLDHARMQASRGYAQIEARSK